MCAKLTEKGTKEFHKEFEALMKKGYPKKRALAASYSILREEGYKVPKYKKKK